MSRPATLKELLELLPDDYKDPPEDVVFTQNGSYVEKGFPWIRDKGNHCEIELNGRSRRSP